MDNVTNNGSSEVHHWHEPTQKQVIKALYQFFDDKKIGTDEIEKIINKKIEQKVEEIVSKLLISSRFDEIIVNKIAESISSEKKAFENNKYGYHNRIRNLVEEKIKELVLNNYEVTIKKR